jgi:hypothetical protein
MSGCLAIKPAAQAGWVNLPDSTKDLLPMLEAHYYRGFTLSTSSLVTHWCDRKDCVRKALVWPFRVLSMAKRVRT